MRSRSGSYVVPNKVGNLCSSGAEWSSGGERERARNQPWYYVDGRPSLLSITRTHWPPPPPPPPPRLSPPWA